MLSHEKLDVYRCAVCAVRFVAFTILMINQIPRGNAHYIDQLKRASLSIPLNIAEGNGKQSKADKARFLGFARGSAMECGALLDVGEIMGLVGEKEKQKGKGLVVRIVSMLTKMI